MVFDMQSPTPVGDLLVPQADARFAAPPRTVINEQVIVPGTAPSSGPRVVRVQGTADQSEKIPS